MDYSSSSQSALVHSKYTHLSTCHILDVNNVNVKVAIFFHFVVIFCNLLTNETITPRPPPFSSQP